MAELTERLILKEIKDNFLKSLCKLVSDLQGTCRGITFLKNKILTNPKLR